MSSHKRKSPHHYRQSFVNDFRKCPRMAQAKLNEETIPFTGDSALIGTAVHAGIEDTLLAAGEFAFTLDDAYDTALHVLRDGWGETRKTLGLEIDGAAVKVKACLEAFFNEVVEFLDPDMIVGIEQEFEVKVAVRESGDLYLQGTMDLLIMLPDGKFQVVDWKTGGAEYGGRNRWKHDRYDVQPTLYIAAAAAMLDLTPEDGSFMYVRMGRDKPSPVEMVTIERTTEDVGFLIQELDNIDELQRADLKAWPLGPTDWWCSPKWCPQWQLCRGSFVGGNPWGTVTEEMAEQVMSEANISF